MLKRKHLVLIEITVSEAEGCTDKRAVQKVEDIVGEGISGVRNYYGWAPTKVKVKSYQRHMLARTKAKSKARPKPKPKPKLRVVKEITDGKITGRIVGRGPRLGQQTPRE